MLAHSEDISDSRKRKILGASEETGFCSESGGRRNAPYRTSCRDARWGLHEGLIPETTRGLHVGWGSGDPMAARVRTVALERVGVAQASGGHLRL